MLCVTTFTKGQMSGTYAVPGTITSIATAIGSLNTLGISGPVTIAISAGYTETAVSGGYTLNAIAGASSINTIVFQKSGVGANPIVYAYSGGVTTPVSSLQDGIWRFSGTDYVTVDGIDLVDPNTANPATMEFGFGFFKANTGDGCQYNTIRNCRITLNRINNAAGSGPAIEGSRGIDVVNATYTAHATALTPTAASGSNSFNKFYSNTIENCNYGIALIGYAAPSPFTLADVGNDIGGNSIATGNTIINFGGGGTTGAAAGIRTLAQYSINVSYNLINNNNGGGVNHGNALRGVFLNTATSAHAAITNNTVTLKSTATSAVCYGINNASGSTAASNTINISGNLITSCTYSSSTGTFAGIINSGSAAFLLLANNLVTSCTYSGTGTFIGIEGGSPVAQNILTNTVTSNVDQGASGTFYCLRAGTSSVTVNGNVVSNNGFSSTSGASSSFIYGMFNVGVPIYEAYINNQINGLYINGSGTSTSHSICGFYSNTSSSSVKTFSANIINSLSTSTTLAGGGVFGIYNTLAATSNVYTNKIYDLSAGGTNGSCWGVFSSSGATHNIYNNLVGDLKTPSSSLPIASAGLYIAGGTSVNVYFNSVYLNASSTATLFGNAAIYASTTPTLDLRNNILVNLSTPSGTGAAIAYARTNAVLTSYAITSNNNLFFAGTPGTGNLIFFDGTNALQTLAAYKFLMSGREGVSVTENPSFVSTTGSSANFLNINTTVPTQIESAGSPIATVLNDYAGNSRNLTAPDIGAWEGTFISNDLTSPVILHSTITNTCNTGDMTFTATISDAGAGVPTSGAFQPRIYFSKNGGAYYSSQGSLVSGNAASGLWSFTVSAATLGGLTMSDLVSYYIIAQDQATTTANVGSYPPVGLSASNVNSVTTPPSVPFSYNITGVLNGVYTVGSGGNFQTLSQAASAYNTMCLSGPVTFSLTDALYSAAETFPIVFQNNLNASSSNSLLIRPASGTAVVITPTQTSLSSILTFSNARFISLDGINSGGTSLSVNNPNVSGASSNIQMLGSGAGNTNLAFSNLNLNGGSNNLSSGIVATGANNDNILISGNRFLKFLNPIYAVGAATVSAGGADNWIISNNTIGPAATGGDNITSSGIYLSGALNAVITGNIVRFIQTSNINVSAININNGVNGFVVSQNSITNIYSSSFGSGVSSIAGIYLGSATINGTLNANLLSTIASTTSSGYGVRGIIVNSNLSNANINIQNNMISNIYCYSDNSPIYWPIGISVENSTVTGVNIDHNTVNLYGTYPAYSTNSGAAAIYLTVNSAGIKLRNNILVNTYDVASGTSETITAVYATNGASVFTSFDYNNYYAAGNGIAHVSYLSGYNTTLSDLQTASSANANSKNVNPVFISSNDLHLQQSTINAALDGQAQALSSVPSDFDGQARNISTPDIGADEVTLTACTSASGGTLTQSSIFSCVGSTASLVSVGSATGVSSSYLWKTSTTAGGPYTPVSGGSGSITTAYTTGTLNTGTYYMVLEMTCGSTSATAVSNEATVTVYAYPTVTAAASATNQCSSASLSLTANASGASSYFWRGPNGYTSTVQNPVITNGSSGTYSLVGSIATCSSAASTISINLIGSLFSTGIAANPSVVCTGGLIQLSANDYALAKANEYSFSARSTTVPLVALSSASQAILFPNNDDTPSSVLSIGFTFAFNGQTYTDFSASPDGWIKLGTGAPVLEFFNVTTSTTNLPRLFPYWDDWATGTTGSVVKDVVGSAPNRTLVVTWFVTVPRNTTGPANSTFQALLHEATGQVEFRYGNVAGPGSNVSCGLTGDATNFNSVTFSTTAASTLTANDSNSLTPLPGSSYIFTPPAITYSWSSPAGVSSTTASAVNSTPSVTSNYSVDLGYAGCTTTRTISVNVVNPPAISITASSFSICPGKSATLTPAGASGYTWTSGSGSVAVVSPTAPVTGYTVIGTNGVCTSTASTNVYVPGNPVINVSGSSGICTGQSAVLVASGAQTYSWNTGATTNSITDSPSISTTYTVTGTDALGCSTTTTQLVSVAATLSITVLGPSSVCSGGSATLTGNGGLTYSWSTGANTSSIVITPTANTSLNLIGYSGSCSNTAVYNVTVNPLPTLSLGTSPTICAGQSATLTASGSATSFSWNTGSSSATIAVSPSVNTTYSVSGFNSFGCETKSVVAVNTNTLPVPLIVATTTGVCLNASATLSVTGVVSNTWNVSGNPTTNTLSISPTGNTIYSVSGTNSQGCVGTSTIAITSYSLPSVNIAPASSTVCALSPVSLVASGASGYTWSANGGTNATVTYSPSGTTVYTVTGQNSNCVNTATASVVTNSLPAISIAPASATICELTPLTYTASGANNYLWNNAVFSPTFLVMPGFSTTYTVQGTGSNGCIKTETVGVTVTPAPTIAITPSMQTVCYNSTSVYTASGAQSYTWATNATGSTVALTPTAPTVYTVAGTGTNGCIGYGSVLLLIHPGFTININPTSATVCPNTSTVFTASGATTYSWSNGSSGASASVVPVVSTVYTVTGFDNNQCARSETVAVVTRTVPVMTISPSSPSVCAGGAIVLTASGVSTYTWTGNVIGPNLMVSPVTSTVYSVSGKSPGSCVASASVGVTVFPTPQINLTASSTTICAKEAVSFTATGGSTYTWSGTNSTGDTYTTVPAVSQNYTVTATDDNGCQGTASVFIQVTNCVGIPEQEQLKGVALYPNPSSGLVQVQFEWEGEKEILVTNSVGAIITQIRCSSDREIINLSSYAKGIYFVRIRANEKIADYKVVIY